MLRRVVLTTLLLVALHSSAFGQVFVSGGAGIPIGSEDVTNLFNPGFGVGAGFILENTAYPFARLRPQGTYQKFQIDPGRLEDEFGELGVEVDGGDMGVIFGGADLQLRLPNAETTPYLAPIVGVAFLAVDDITAGNVTFNVEEEETAIAIGIGAGLATRLSGRFELFVEGHYIYAFTEGDNLSWIPIRFGLALNLTD